VSGGNSSVSLNVVWKESELLGALWIKVGRIGTVTTSREAMSESYCDSRGNVGDVGDPHGVFRRT
jgi:hypothetical protein